METAELVNIVIKAIDKATGPLGKIGRALNATSHIATKSADKIVNAFTRRVGGAFSKVAGMAKYAQLAIGALGAAVAAKATSGIITATAEYEKFQAILETIGGGKAQGNKLLEWANKFAAKTPYELRDVVQGMTRLEAYGIDATKGALRVIGDFSASMGRNVLDGVEAVADAVMGEWERMKEFGVKRDLLEKWITSKGFRNPFNKSGQVIDQGAMLPLMLKYMQERSGGAMAKMMDTIEGKWSNLKDSAYRAAVGIGKTFSTHLKRVLTFITLIIEKVASPQFLAKVGAWADKMFSEDNVRKFLTLIANAYGWIASLGDTTGKVFGQIKIMLARVVDSAILAMEQVYNAARNSLLSPFVEFGNHIIDVLNNVKRGWVDFTENIKDRWNAIKYAITHPGSGMIRYGEYPKPKQRDYDFIPHLSLPQNQLNTYGMRSDIWNKIMQMRLPGFNGVNMFDPKLINDKAKGAFNFLWDMWQQAGKPAKVESALEEIAANTGRLVQQTDDVLSKVYGAGPGTESLTRRLMFGAGAVPYTPMAAQGAGGMGMANVSVNANDPYLQEYATRIAKQVLSQLGVPHVIKR